MEGHVVGLSAVFITSIAWAVSPTLISRFAYSVSEYTFAMLRSFFAVISLSMILLFINIQFSLEGILVTLISAILGPIVGAVSYVKSIKLIGSGNAVSISYLYIFFAQFSSYTILGERASLLLYIGSVIALMGVFIVCSGESHVMNRIGIVYGLIAAISGGLASAVLKVAVKYGDPLSIAFLRNLFSLVILAPFTYDEAFKVTRDKGVLLTLVFTGSLGLGLGMWFFIYAMDILGVSATVLVTSLTPVLTRIFSVYIAREKPSRKAYIGTIVTSLGIIVGLHG